MFDRKHVDEVMESLKKEVRYFVSEAHLQMSFIQYAMQLHGNDFEFYPEYPIQREGTDKRDELDLLILDKASKEKTIIEFKHKTANTSNKSLIVKTPSGIEFCPTAMNAQDLGRFDCWSDIERIERCVDQKLVTNGFLVFITNDSLYWGKVDSKGLSVNYDLSSGKHEPCFKKWNIPSGYNTDRLERSVGRIRNKENGINIKGSYHLKWEEFVIVPDFKEMLKPREKKECGVYQQLIVEIK